MADPLSVAWIDRLKESGGEAGGKMQAGPNGHWVRTFTVETPLIDRRHA